MAGKLFGAWPVAGSGGTGDADTAKVNGTVVPKHRVGSMHPDVNGGLWVYVSCTATVLQGDWVTIDEAGLAQEMTDAATDAPVGVMGAAVTANDYGFAQVYGSNTHAASTDVADNAPLYSDTLDGHVDDAIIAQRLIVGAVARSADATTDTALTGFITAQLNFPFRSSDIADTVLA